MTAYQNLHGSRYQIFEPAVFRKDFKTKAEMEKWMKAHKWKYSGNWENNYLKSIFDERSFSEYPGVYIGKRCRLERKS